jgi:hypothetical protein
MNATKFPHSGNVVAKAKMLGKRARGPSLIGTGVARVGALVPRSAGTCSG